MKRIILLVQLFQKLKNCGYEISLETLNEYSKLQLFDQ